MTTGAARKAIVMFEFLTALIEPGNEFLRLAFLAGILASFAFGIMGTYVVTNRISFIAGAIAHTAFGGIGAGIFLQKRIGLEWFDPMYGAVIYAVLAAVVIGIVKLYAGEREDTAIGALWAVGMASGLIFIDITPGYFDITSYLFGDILLISTKDLYMVAALDIVVAVLAMLFYNKILAVCFDDEFAGLRGINVGSFYILMLCITALTVVLLVRVVGIIMVIALLTLPAAIAGRFAKKIWQMIGLAVMFCMFFSCTGLAISYKYSFSSGPTIIMLAGITYLIVIATGNIWSKIR